MVFNMAKPTFSRKIIDNHGSLQVTIPKEITKVLNLKAGDLMVILLENDKIICQKALEV